MKKSNSVFGTITIISSFKNYRSNIQVVLENIEYSLCPCLSNPGISCLNSGQQPTRIIIDESLKTLKNHVTINLRDPNGPYQNNPQKPSRTSYIKISLQNSQEPYRKSSQKPTETILECSWKTDKNHYWLVLIRRFKIVQKYISYLSDIYMKLVKNGQWTLVWLTRMLAHFIWPINCSIIFLLND